MNHITKYIFVILSLIMLTGCSGSEQSEERPKDTLAPISLTLSVPNDKSNTRVGDPGADTNDKVDWDRLTIIIAYTEKTKGKDIYDGSASTMVYYDTFTKDEFDRKTPVSHDTSTLSPADTNGYHDYTIYLPPGTCCVYGVTYSDGEGLDLEEELSKIPKDGKKGHNADIYKLQISNDYAWNINEMDIAKFISVATGYATEVNVANNTLTDNRLIPVEFNSNTTSSTKRYWRMVLGRLATKLDIQWDAKGAYENDANGIPKFNDVKVEGFTYHGEAEGTGTSGTGTSGTGSTTTEVGYGRLFPTLYAASTITPKTSVGGQKAFINTSEISKRNGRVYHYTFPDGITQPRITFDVSTKKDKDAETKTDKVTFDFKYRTKSFNPAQWYKINVTIKGTQIGKESNITINEFKE